MTTSTPIIFDTDGGVDDASALWYALTDPAIDVVAVTTVRGVVSAEQAATNMCAVLEAAGRPDVPVAVGADKPVGPAPDVPTTDMIHGANGLGNVEIPEPSMRPVEESAVDLINRLASERPGEITLVAVGPVSNVALALRAEPELTSRLEDLFVMGGGVSPPGNATPLAEFNIVFDPGAAAETVGADWPRPPTMVMLDATEEATLRGVDFDLLSEQRTPAAEFLAGPLGFYRMMASMANEKGECPCHDALTVMSVVHPEVIEVSELPLEVDTGGSAAWGVTVVDLRARILEEKQIPEELLDLAKAEIYGDKPIWRVALGADVPAFQRRMRGMFGDTAS